MDKKQQEGSKNTCGMCESTARPPSGTTRRRRRVVIVIVIADRRAVGFVSLQRTHARARERESYTCRWGRERLQINKCSPTSNCLHSNEMPNAHAQRVRKQKSNACPSALETTETINSQNQVRVRLLCLETKRAVFLPECGLFFQSSSFKPAKKRKQRSVKGLTTH